MIFSTWSHHLMLILLCVFVFELLRYLRLLKIIRNNLKIYKKILKLLNYIKISETKKKKIFFLYLKKLFTSSVKILFFCASIFFIVLVFNILNDKFLSFIISLFGFIEIIVISFIYYRLKKIINEKL